MKKKVLSILLTLALCLTLLPATALAADPAEQFSGLTPGGTYWFDLSGADIPGTVNEGEDYGGPAVPDATLHWVPFTYAGTVDAYVLKSRSGDDETAKGDSANAAGSTDPSNPIGYTYDHSLFIADYGVTHKVNWETLDGKKLIFGKSYTSGGVDYTLRAPSAGSNSDTSGVTPASNEWDAILGKDSNDIKNWSAMYSWGQDTCQVSNTLARAVRGNGSARGWCNYRAASSHPTLGFRPVLEILNPDTLGSGGLTTVTLDLNGGSIGSITGTVNLAVKSSGTYTAPSSDGLTRPTGNTGTYFKWQDSSGNFYEPGEQVPADVTGLTALWGPPEQFSGLTPGGTYWFDLSGADIPGNKNDSLPDKTLHWVPFTYAGTVHAYTRTEAGVSTQDSVTPYDHSLFIADYNVTHTVNWNDLNGENLIFGTAYASGGVDYTLRAPSAGSGDTGSGGTPASNEWDAILDKSSNYIKNRNDMYSWGQDTFLTHASYRAYRGSDSARYWSCDIAVTSRALLGFRPVLELPSADTLGADGLTTVTLDLNGGHVGSDNTAVTVNLAVKSSGTYTAPSSDGLTRPTGNTGTYFKWQDSSGNFYEPGEQVPADVTGLTALWVPEQFTTLTPGETYWFDLSGADIPGNKNDSLPDDSLHWVPFTYAGTVNAYVLKSRSANDDTAKGDSANAAGSTDPTNPIGYTYDHSLFIADYNVTRSANWVTLNGKNLIFGTAYTSGGVGYTLRAPSAGSSRDTSGGTPASNEWDAILNKNSDDIKNWNGMDSWGQDTHDGPDPDWNRATRGSFTARSWQFDLKLSPSVGFRPVLEILNPGDLGSDGLTTVTLDLNGGHVGSDDTAVTVNLAVKSSGTYTAPSGDGLTRPTGNTGAYFKWQDSSGNFYEPGDTVSADVTRLTALWAAVPVTITEVAPAAGLTYNGQPQTGYTGTPTNAQGYNGDYTVTYSGRGGTTYDASPTAPSKAGDYAVAIAVPDSVQDFTGETTLNFTIAKAEITVTADDKTAYVGDMPPALTCTVTGLVNGETLKTQPKLAYESGPDMSKAGTTAIKASGAEAPDGGNYDITYVDGTLTVSTRPSSGGGGGGYTPPTYPPTVEQPDEGGTVTVSPKNPEKGDKVTITPKPDEGYEVEQILVTDKNGDAVEVTNNGDGTYSFTQPAGKVNVKVTFMEDNTMLNFFVDVFPSDYYYDAVLWAAEKGITGGVDDTHFAPNAPCTRAQIVTFLWRAAGSPEPKNLSSLSDVPADAYYAKAVAWALENGITTGTGNGMFSPDATCTRAQAMTFIYRSVQAQGGGMQDQWMFRNPFSDVDTENYYGEAVMWAVANGITSGTSDTTFSPGADCTRAQIVTFLYRCLGE